MPGTMTAPDTGSAGYAPPAAYRRAGAALAAEWIKLRSLRSMLLTALLGALACIGVADSAVRNNATGWAHLDAAQKAQFDPLGTNFNFVVLGILVFGVFGALVATNEYGSGLIRGTFVATPQRAQVLAMKALVFTAVVWACCTAMSFAAFFLGQNVLSPARHAGIGDPGVLTAVFGAGFYLTLVGLLGMFIGVVVRRTPAALAALFGLLLVLPIVVHQIPGKITKDISEFLPDAGEQAFRQLVHSGANPLGRWQGLGVEAAYVAVTAVAAVTLVRRRDA